MKNLVLAAVALLGVAGCCHDRDIMQNSTGSMRHVVLFKFKDGTTPAQIKAIEDKFRELPSKLPAILAFEWGTDVSPEKLSQGFTHCFLVTFKNAAGS